MALTEFLEAVLHSTEASILGLHNPNAELNSSLLGNFRRRLHCKPLRADHYACTGTLLLLLRLCV